MLEVKSEFNTPNLMDILLKDFNTGDIVCEMINLTEKKKKNWAWLLYQGPSGNWLTGNCYISELLLQNVSFKLSDLR